MGRSLIVVLLLSGVAFSDDTKTIPLDSVHATTGQKGVKALSLAQDGTGKYVEPYGANLAIIREGIPRSQSAALVAGKDIASAIEATVGKLGGKADAVTIQNGATLWLAVYLGTNGSSPPAFTVENVTLKEKTVRLKYKRGAAFTDDLHVYLAWVPLRVAAPGEYAIELIETGSKKVTFKKAVRVVEKK